MITRYYRCDETPIRQALVNMVRLHKMPFNNHGNKKIAKESALYPYFYVNEEGAGFSRDTSSLHNGNGNEVKNDTWESILNAIRSWLPSEKVSIGGFEFFCYRNGNVQFNGKYSIPSEVFDKVVILRKKFTKLPNMAPKKPRVKKEEVQEVLP